MARKTIDAQRADLIAQREAITRERARLDTQAAARIGALAVKAGLSDLLLDDSTLSAAFAELAARFQGERNKAVGHPADPTRLREPA